MPHSVVHCNSVQCINVKCSAVVCSAGLCRELHRLIILPKCLCLSILELQQWGTKFKEQSTVHSEGGGKNMGSYNYMSMTFPKCKLSWGKEVKQNSKSCGALLSKFWNDLENTILGLDAFWPGVRSLLSRVSPGCLHPAGGAKVSGG